MDRSLEMIRMKCFQDKSTSLCTLRHSNVDFKIFQDINVQYLEILNQAPINNETLITSKQIHFDLL